MNLEQTARRAAVDLRLASDTDVEAALAELLTAAPRRRRAHAVLTACALVLVLAAGWGVARWVLPEDASTLEPAGETSASPNPTPASGSGCEATLVTCLGKRRFTVAMDVPMTWTLPRPFEAPYSGSTPDHGFVESYGRDVGVTVVEAPRAAGWAGGAVVTFPGVDTAESFAEWLAARPFLSTSGVRATELDGRPAWTVDAVVRPGQGQGPARCNRTISCFPVILHERLLIGTWKQVTSRYTFVDLPGVGVSVVWAWSFEGELPARISTVVDSIRFG